jgi:hypothetical protein
MTVLLIRMVWARGAGKWSEDRGTKSAQIQQQRGTREREGGREEDGEEIDFRRQIPPPTRKARCAHRDARGGLAVLVEWSEGQGTEDSVRERDRQREGKGEKQTASAEVLKGDQAL